MYVLEKVFSYFMIIEPLKSHFIFFLFLFLPCTGNYQIAGRSYESTQKINNGICLNIYVGTIKCKDSQDMRQTNLDKPSNFLTESPMTEPSLPLDYFLKEFFGSGFIVSFIHYIHLLCNCNKVTQHLETTFFKNTKLFIKNGR